MLLNQTVSQANDCKDVFDACDKVIKEKNEAIEAKNKALELKDLAIKDCGTKNSALQTNLDEEMRKNNSIFKNPFAMILLGIAAGAAATAVIKK